MPTIVFVCTGNTCRSSMAEAIARNVLRQMGREQEVRVLSAGTYAFAGVPASPEAARVMAEAGLDIEQHRARELTEEIIAEADLILTMTKRHLDRVISISPEAVEKAFTLTGYALTGQDQDIEDPFGRTAEDYRQCAVKLQAVIGVALARFLHQIPNTG